MDIEYLKNSAINGNDNSALLLGWKTACEDNNINDGIDILKDALIYAPDNAFLTSALAGCFLLNQEENQENIDDALKLFSSVTGKLIASYESGYARLLFDNNDRECMEWYKSSYSQGNISAAIDIANAYKDGKYVEKDHDLYMYYMKAASDLGDIEARVIFADEMIKNSDNDSEIKYGINILIEISNANRPQIFVRKACQILFKIFMSGDKIGKNEDKAINYVKRIADLGDFSFLLDTAQNYSNGENGFEVNKVRALELYEYAGELGDRTAMEKIGEIYYRGDGTPSNPQKALEWYMKAARKGSYDSLIVVEKLLGSIYPNQVGQFYLNLLRDMKEDGYYAAYLKLYFLYRKGRYVEKDLNAAIEYLKIAVDGEYANACVIYGELEMNGDDELCISQDKKQAVYLWKKAANKKHKYAFLNLGRAYMEGDGVEVDIDKAEEYLTKAEESGLIEANMYLGDLFFLDKYGKKDIDRALNYYSLSCENGMDEKLCFLGHIYENEKNEKDKALSIYKKSADLGNKDGIFNYGRLLCELSLKQQGNCDYNCFKIGSDYLQKALELGHSNAESFLLMNYKFDMILHKEYDDPKSENYRFRRDEFNFMLRHGDVADADIQKFIADCFFEGRLESNDKERGFTWLNKAANSGSDVAKLEIIQKRYGNPESHYVDFFMAERMLKELISNSSDKEIKNEAMFDLGKLYFKDLDNKTEGLKWFKKVAENGDASAEYNLGLCYYNGWGVEVDKKKAHLWLKKASEHGDEEAAEMLNELFDNIPESCNLSYSGEEIGIETWKCKKCGAINNIGRGMCPKCGTVKGYY